MTITVEPLTGPELASALPELARLRIDVFRAYPYLYDGDLAYEERYLQTYLESDRAILVAARDGDRVVGAATGAPLTEHAPEFAAPLQARGFDVDQIFYCAESVLLPEYRSRGIGHAFFDRREAHARALGFRYAAFCSVIRPKDHPARPAHYRPLDAFWRKRGYEPLEGVTAEFPWKDIGEDRETPKPMQFWMREL